MRIAPDTTREEMRRKPANPTAVQKILLEDPFRAQVRQTAAYLGWKLQYHTHNSRRSDKGFPDEVFAREGDRVIFVEAKKHSGNPTPDQEVWMRGLAAAGAEVYLWRPGDWNEIEETLRRRR